MWEEIFSKPLLIAGGAGILLILFMDLIPTDALKIMAAVTIASFAVDRVVAMSRSPMMPNNRNNTVTTASNLNSTISNMPGGSSSGGLYVNKVPDL